MIARLRGIVIEKTIGSAIIEAGGVGYEVVVTAADHGSLTMGEEASLHIFEQIREDAHNLYGFSNLASKHFFEQLLSISGIGPKVAINILSAAGLPQLQSAIAGGDPEILRGVAGVGKKTAERIVVELKTKMEAVGLTAGGMGEPVSSGDAAYQALIGLGYTPAQAAEALRGVPSSIKKEQDRVKAALKQLI
ncbi:MAG TPA: Holliday junction branch migration protein RuvA [Candidatus Saccharimonadia bacterium]